MTTGASAPRARGETRPWKRLQRHGFTLQTRSSRASCRDDVRTVRTLQRRLVQARAARFFAVRSVAHENQGNRRAGVDGVKAWPPPQRLALAHTLRIGQTAQPVRRVGLPQPHATDLRPFGIPVRANRAGQAFSTAALEPAGEARFEPTSEGFRPGRRGQEAIEAILASIAGQATSVLDADLAPGFDRLAPAILPLVRTSPRSRRQL